MSMMDIIEEKNVDRIAPLEAQLKTKTEAVAEMEAAIEWFVVESVYNDLEIEKLVTQRQHTKDGWAVKEYSADVDDYVWDGIEHDTFTAALLAADRAHKAAEKGDADK